jgi:hypothetical protein
MPGTPITLQFPMDEERTKYKGTVSFTALEENYASITSVGEQLELLTGLLTRIDNVTDGAGETVDIPGATASNFVSSGQVPVTKATAKSYGNTIELYLPQALQFTDGVAYQDFDLGPAGEAIRQGIMGGEGIVRAVQKGINNSAQSFTSLLKKGIASDVATVAAVRTAQRFGQTGEGAVSSATGVAVNPNKRTGLRSVNIRRFRFTFKLIPTSLPESLRIKSIIKFFRSELYPEQIAINGIPVGYRYPKKFEIELRYNGQRIATKILPCFLETVDVVYNPSTMSFHPDGNFSEVDITLGFVEERALVKQDIVGGQYETLKDKYSMTSDYSTYFPGDDLTTQVSVIDDYEGGY